MSLRSRTTVGLLSLAILASAGIAPAQAGKDLLLDPAQVHEFHERAAEARQAETLSAPSGAMTAGMVNPEVERVWGENRYETAAALSTFWSDVVWPQMEVTQRPVIIASGESFPDALSGGPYATQGSAPVLLTTKKTLPSATRAALEDLRPGIIIILGGTEAVSAQVQEELAAFVTHPALIGRVGGANRYEVSARIATRWGSHTKVYVASGANWPDGLAGGAAAGVDGVPLLLTKPDDVPAVVMKALKTMSPSEIVVVGGPASVGGAAVRELQTLAPVTRISGTDRYETAAKLASFGPNYHGATMASGLNWPDALAGSAFAGITGDKLLLLRPTSVPSVTSGAVTKLDLAWITVIGGPASIADTVLDELAQMKVDAPAAFSQ